MAEARCVNCSGHDGLYVLSRDANGRATYRCGRCITAGETQAARLAALAPDLLAFVAETVPQLDQSGPPLSWAARQQLAAQGRALLAQAEEGETA